MLVCWRRIGNNVCVQIVDVHVSSGETTTWRDVEVSDHFVHAENTFDSTSFTTLLVELVGESFPLTLLDVAAVAKGPLLLGIGFAHFVARRTTAGLDHIGRGLGATASTTVFGI
jgi:hypothetical protein